MNLYDIYTEKERQAILDEVNIIIENRNYTKDERVKIANTITDGIMNKSSKNNEISNSFMIFNPIIDKLKIEKEKNK